MNRNVGQRSRTQVINRRAGYTLVLVVMLLFGILAMAALVIDIGFARLAQRQMQTAVDSAALEGLRFRDDDSVSDPVERNRRRRERASQIIAWTFDDDLDVASGDDGAFDSGSGQFGAGPLVELSGGAGDLQLHASQLMTVPEIAVYRPANNLIPGLAINEGDVPDGDMVSGVYLAAPDNATPEENRVFHTEENDYSRRDFDPEGSDDSAFLVRMRRTTETSLEDTVTVGPTLPYLFARGSLLNRQSIGRGISVRSTGLAATRNVLTSGPAYPVNTFTNFQGLVGLAPFAVASNAWPSNSLQITIQTRLFATSFLLTDISQSITALPISFANTLLQPSDSDPIYLRIESELVLVRSVDALNQTITVTRGVGGTTASIHQADTPVVKHRTLQIGKKLTDLFGSEDVTQINSLDKRTHRIVPLYDHITDRVVGFGYVASWNWQSATGELILDVRAQHIESGNVSATIRPDLEAPQDLPDLLQINRTLSTTVLAPVSVR